MDLLSTLSGMTPEASAAALASAFASQGNGSDCCGGELTFHATLTSLLGPPPTDGTHGEALAAAVAELETGAVAPEAADAGVWPLAAFLGAGEVLRSIPADANDLDVSDDVPVTLASEIDPGSNDVPSGRADGVVVGGELATGTDAATPIGTGDELPAPPTPTVDAEPAGLTTQPRDPGATAATSHPAGDVGDRSRTAEVQVEDDAAAARIAGDRGRTVGGAEDAAWLRSSDRAEAQRPAQRADPVPETSRAAAGTVAENPAPQGPTASTQGRATLGMADGVRRVLEAIELLENAPPPRQLTIEIGEGRLRVALEDGQVRLSVMDGGSEDLDEFLQAAEQALAEHGFDLGGDGPRDEPSSDQPTTTDQQRRPPTRSAAPGLRL